MRYKDRQKKLIKAIEDARIDALLVEKKENIAYLTGARGEDAILFVSPKKTALITDQRYEEEYKKTAEGCSIIITKNKNAGSVIADACRQTRSKAIGFEAHSLSYQGYASLKKRLKNIRLKPFARIVEKLRIIKDAEEIGHIKRACALGSQLMNFAIKTAAPGISEKSLKNSIESYALKNNISLAGFDIIVASGINAAMPHASASNKKIKSREMITIDLGAMHCGYNSDLTRTVFLGTINRKYYHIYDIVLASQSAAITRARPGILAKDLDAVSRRYISNKGMGRFFLHSLGHGIGRETHESPAISQTSEIRLEKGMVITIEPGIYMPGWGGVRIEDTVLITENGCEVLTQGAMKYASRD